MMNEQIAGSGPLMKAKRFIRVNGLYLFVCELGRRAGIAFRRWMLAGKLDCPDIVLGPRCYLRGLANMRIGKNFQAAEEIWLEAVVAYRGQSFSPSIVIGNNVSISRWSHIAATHRIEIGDGVLIGSKVLITDHNHGQYRNGTCKIDISPSLRPLDLDRTVVIGKNVWLGDGVVVMPGVTIGEGCVIGANSVVTRNVAPFTIAAGVPAVALKRFDSGTQEWRGL
jgi:lipopolysaccharide O-acetyltransferase